MSIKLLLFSLLLFTFQLYGQEGKRDNIWMLGAHALPHIPNIGMSFNSGTADTFSLLRPMAFFMTNAGISDTNGFLLFYTNGNYVANRNHQMMPNSAGFNPGYQNSITYPYGTGLVQGALILPWPDSQNAYAILHMDADTFMIGMDAFQRPLSFRYSKVDMTLDNGRGDLTNEKNVVLIEDTLVLGRIAACKHANGRDWWILTHELWSDQFYKFLLTPDTILFHHNQFIGSVVTHRMDVFGAGVFSKNGEMFAYSNGDTILNIFHFNRCTGQLSYPTIVYFPDSHTWGLQGCAFSASGRFLYVCNSLEIYQLDLHSTNIPASKTVVASYDGFTTSHGFRSFFNLMKLAPDDKIYVSTYEGTNVFHVINYPDSVGLSCDVTQHSFVLPGYNAFSMPNVANYSLGPLTGSICDSLNIGIEEMEIDNSSLMVYPNPSSGQINISLNEEIRFKSGQLDIYSVIGAKVFSKKVSDVNGLENINVRLPDGIFMCSLVLEDKKRFNGKISIVH